MNFYEIKQQWNNLQWTTIVFFKRKQDAEKYLIVLQENGIGKFEIFERKFSKLSELEEYAKKKQ